MIEALEALAIKAGEAILEVYARADFGVQTKHDRSPVTDADLAAHHIIIAGLKDLGGLPYISEEEPPKTYPHPPARYWLIDPLDGTKEFVAKRDSFTVNIALIEDGVPTHAVVYAPVWRALYSGAQGVYREQGQTVVPAWKEGRVLLSSRSHPDPRIANFIERNAITEHERAGSSIKFCWVASGRAHLYPRFNPLHAWDTAAGDGVARAAGCRVFDWKTGLPPTYAYEQSYTPGFCVSAPHISVSY